uniref:Reverse transcriptase domain-containing protein n=1 Tax=Tanacetum cinerariifolium TaxID=118510 RepID=A0A6L2LAK5_TANCI|nr:reverse transcriptase domain-containing protein [Tanacetum cinerariifolium]
MRLEECAMWDLDKVMWDLDKVTWEGRVEAMGTIPMCVCAQESWGEGTGVLAGKLDEIHIRTLGDYFRPSNEGYQNTVELLDRNNVVPLRSNTICLREVPSIDELEPHPNPLPSFPSLDVSLGDERGPEPPIKPRSPDSFRMKELDSLTIHTHPSPHVASFHPKDITRSSARNLFPPLDNPELTIQTRSRADHTLLNDFKMAAEGNGDLLVPDLQTMEELCQPSLNGRGGLISLISIQATNFRLKNDMIQQVQNSCQFHGLLGDDANKHLDKFLHVTQSIKVNGVTDDALSLYLFSHSLTHHATTWFDRLPRNSVNTFEQMAKMFLGKYFPPSMVTKLRNEITNFRQRPNESLFEAWERYKLSIDRCPNHNMLPVTQIDTFYNGLTLRHRDTINVAACGTFMKRHPEECCDLIENMTAYHNDWDISAQWSESSSSITSSFDTEIIALKAKMAEINKNLMRVLQVNQQVKAVTLNCETCGGPHSFSDCPATVGQTQNGALHGQNPPPAYQIPAYQASVYQAPVHQPQIPQPQVVTTSEFTNFMKANDAILKNMQTNMTSLTNSNLELKNMFGQFMKMNTASSSGLGTLPGERKPKKDKIGSKPDKNGKRVEAGKSLKQLQLKEEEKPKKTKKEWPKTHTRIKSYPTLKERRKEKGQKCNSSKVSTTWANCANCSNLWCQGRAMQRDI